MPRGDRTGPQGEGPMTGRQLGYGAGYDSPGYTKGAGMGRGFLGKGRAFFGRGRGYRHFWIQGDVPDTAEPIRKSDDLNSLRSEVEGLKNSLSSILEKINALTSKKE